MPKGIFNPLSEEKEQIIRDQYLNKPVKTLAKELGTSASAILRRLKLWGLEIPKELIEQRKAANLFQKGHTSFNKGRKQTEYMTKEGIANSSKTRFKKGNKPHNTKYDGYERTSKDGYVEVRISKGVFKLKHNVIWENAHGNIPEGCIIRFKDSDRSNFSLDNLEMITRQENMLRNHYLQYPEEIIPSLLILNKFNNSINQIENGTK